MPLAPNVSSLATRIGQECKALWAAIPRRTGGWMNPGVRIVAGGGQDLAWKTIASAQFPAANGYAGVSWRVRYIKAEGNFGNAHSIELEYSVYATRSAGAPPDDNVVTAVRGPVAEYVRAVRVNNEWVELQVRQAHDWHHYDVTVEVNSSSATNLFWHNPMVAGTTTGTIVNATNGQLHTFGTLSGNEVYDGGVRVVRTNDTRLSDARTPTAHTHTKANITDFAHTHPSTEVTGLGNAATRNVGTTAGTVAAGDDTRLLSNVTRVVYTTTVPARPTGATYVEWVGQVDPGANSLAGDTWVPTT